MRSIRVALIGTGIQGMWLASGLAVLPVHFGTSRYRIIPKLLCDVVADVGERATAWGWEGSSRDWTEVVDRSDIDLVIVATPTFMHYEIVRSALLAGKLVFCEKPLTMSSQQGLDIWRLVATTGQRLGVAFNKRRLPAVQYAKQLFEAGYVGEPLTFRGSHRTDSGIDPSTPLGWRYRRDQGGSGPMHEMACHLFDVTRFILGEFDRVVGDAATHISARAVPGHGGEIGVVDVEDSCAFVARMDSGVLATFETTRQASGDHARMSFEIFGREGSIRWDSRRYSELEISSEQDPAETRGLKAVEMGKVHPYGQFMSGYGDMAPGYSDTLAIQIRDFIEACIADTPFTPDVVDGLRVNEIIDAVFSSVQSGTWASVEKGSLAA
jgi:predicted dehydrogenase